MSLANLGQSLLRQIGINVHRWPSQRHLVFEYPVADEPRYGLKTGPYLPMLDLLEAKREQMSATLVEIAKQVTLLQGIPANSNGNSLAPYWDNGWFPPLDACVFMHFLLKYRPRRYVEIGSGNSTIFAHYAKCFGNLETTITSIDPQPRAGIDMLCDNIFREGLQSADLSLFDELQPGDIIFFDGSHVVFQDSDVTVFFLEVLPRIKAGVIVHVHDIFWPRDYPKNWGTRSRISRRKVSSPCSLPP